MNDHELRLFRDEITSRVTAWAAAATAPLPLIAQLNGGLSAIVKEFKQRNGGKWLDGQGEMIQRIIQQALVDIETSAIAAAATDDALRDALRDYFLITGPIDRYHAGRQRFDQVAQLGDDASVELVFEAAQRALLSSIDDEFNPSPLFGVVILAKTDRHRDRALDFFRTAFVTARAAAGTQLVNDSCFANLGRCLAALGDQSFAPLIYDALAFAADPEQNYELNLAATHLAVYLTALDYQGPLDAVTALCAYLDDTYAGEAFTLRASYARWVLEGDAAGAAAYVGTTTNTKSLGLAATACADLHHTAALPVLEHRLTEIKAAVTREVFTEAIARLRAQTAPPAIADRMIWLHGSHTRVELALGEDSDNVFELRAALATETPISPVLEVDDSAPSDV